MDGEQVAEVVLAEAGVCLPGEGAACQEGVAGVVLVEGQDAEADFKLYLLSCV